MDLNLFSVQKCSLLKTLGPVQKLARKIVGGSPAQNGSMELSAKIELFKNVSPLFYGSNFVQCKKQLRKGIGAHQQRYIKQKAQKGSIMLNFLSVQKWSSLKTSRLFMVQILFSALKIVGGYQSLGSDLPFTFEMSLVG